MTRRPASKPGTPYTKENTTEATIDLEIGADELLPLASIAAAVVACWIAIDRDRTDQLAPLLKAVSIEALALSQATKDNLVVLAAAIVPVSDAGRCFKLAGSVRVAPTLH